MSPPRRAEAAGLGPFLRARWIRRRHVRRAAVVALAPDDVSCHGTRNVSVTMELHRRVNRPFRTRCAPGDVPRRVRGNARTGGRHRVGARARAERHQYHGAGRRRPRSPADPAGLGAALMCGPTLSPLTSPRAGRKPTAPSGASRGAGRSVPRSPGRTSCSPQVGGAPWRANGWRQPWYAAALIATTVLALMTRRQVGAPARIGRGASGIFWRRRGRPLAALFSRLPLSTWTQIPFKDDYTPLFQSAVNGVRLLQRGSVVGWNWWLLGGYPTSTDIAQSFGALVFFPMVLLAIGSATTCFTRSSSSRSRRSSWWDIRQEDAEEARSPAALRCSSRPGISSRSATAETRTR